MSYLAINKSGSSFPVYDSRKVQIGTISPNEKFAVQAGGPVESGIDFLDGSGRWRSGYCKNVSGGLSNWINYAYSHSGHWINDNYFKAAESVNVYNSGGEYERTLPAGTLILPYNRNSAENGTNNTDWLRVKTVYDPSGNTLGNVHGMYVDCKLRYNSMNTAVVGNW